MPRRRRAPEALLNRVIESGFPWNVLGTKLKAIDDQFRVVSEEYASIHDSIGRLQDEVGSLGRDVEQIRNDQGNLTERIRQIVREEIPAIQDRWLIGTASLIAVLIGLGLSVFGSPDMRQVLATHGAWIGASLVILGVAGGIWLARRRRPQVRSES